MLRWHNKDYNNDMNFGFCRQTTEFNFWIVIRLQYSNLVLVGRLQNINLGFVIGLQHSTSGWVFELLTTMMKSIQLQGAVPCGSIDCLLQQQQEVQPTA